MTRTIPNVLLYNEKEIKEKKPVCGNIVIERYQTKMCLAVQISALCHGREVLIVNTSHVHTLSRS